MLQDLQKSDLYRSHKMNEDFDGGCFSTDISSVTINGDGEMFALLDAACRLGDLYPISTGWRKLTYDDAKATLYWGFQNDLAYGGTRLGKKKAYKYLKIILDQVDPGECHCFTNWTDDPWKDGMKSWHGVSKNTFDISVVVFDKRTLVLTYLVSED